VQSSEQTLSSATTPPTADACSITIESVATEQLAPYLAVVVRPRLVIRGKVEAQVTNAATGEAHTVRAGFVSLQLR